MAQFFDTFDQEALDSEHWVINGQMPGPPTTTDHYWPDDSASFDATNDAIKLGRYTGRGGSAKLFPGFSLAGGFEIDLNCSWTGEEFIFGWNYVDTNNYYRIVMRKTGLYYGIYFSKKTDGSWYYPGNDYDNGLWQYSGEITNIKIKVVPHERLRFVINDVVEVDTEDYYDLIDDISIDNVVFFSAKDSNSNTMYLNDVTISQPSENETIDTPVATSTYESINPSITTFQNDFNFQVNTPTIITNSIIGIPYASITFQDTEPYVEGKTRVIAEVAESTYENATPEIYYDMTITARPARVDFETILFTPARERNHIPIKEIIKSTIIEVIK